MLTPIEIQGKTFKNSGMGYSKADVDSFFSSVSADFEALYKENLSLKEKINNLDASLSHYKEIEKSLQKALVLAETTAEETIVGAKKNASGIEQEAVLKAQSSVADAKVELEQLHVKTTDLLQQYDRYRTQYKALASAQLDLLNSEAFDIMYGFPSVPSPLLYFDAMLPSHVGVLLIIALLFLLAIVGILKETIIVIIINTSTSINFLFFGKLFNKLLTSFIITPYTLSYPRNIIT